MKKLININAILISLMILISAFTASVYAESAILIHGKFNFDYSNEMSEYINEYRARNGLDELEIDASLVEPAMIRAAELSVNFSHVRPNTKYWSTAVEWEEAVAENIAMGFSNPEEATEAYYNSVSHRENMLGDYTRMGVGVFTADNGANYWVHIFTRGEVKASYKETGIRYVNLDIADDPDEETYITYLDGEPSLTEKARQALLDRIPEIKSVSLSKTVFVYNGKNQEPEIRVKDKEGNIISDKYYNVDLPKRRSACGVYTIKVSAKYSDTVLTKTFKITPKTVSINNVYKNKKSIVVKWNRASSSVTGYKLSIAANKSFTRIVRTYFIKRSKTSKIVKGLKTGKKYYFKLRAYKDTGEKTLYSDWSKIKRIKNNTNS